MNKYTINFIFYFEINKINYTKIFNLIKITNYLIILPKTFFSLFQIIWACVI